MTNLEMLYANLVLNNNDWETRLALADYYEELGELQTAQCIRWMVKYHKRPYYRHMCAGGLCWLWFNEEYFSKVPMTKRSDIASDLPGEVYKQLKSSESIGAEHAYNKLQKADEDFYQAWIAACKNGWNPDKYRRYGKY